MADIAFEKITAKKVPTDEPFACGHRACSGCGEVLALRLICKALGEKSIAVSATGCMEIISSPYPFTSWSIPWIHVAFENAAAVASGIEAGRKSLIRKGKLPEDQVNVVAFAGDGGTADIGIQALSGAAERGHDMIYVCLDNEAYMNTGIQRSSETPYGAMTTTSPPGECSIGQVTWKKDMPAIMAAHKIPYVATASVARPYDLMNKARKAAAVQGPAYLHVFSPCNTGWRMDAARSIEVAQLALDTKVFPLYEVIDGRYVLNFKVKKPKPVEEYLKPQRRFRHLGPDEIAYIQQRIDREYDHIVALSEMGAEPEPDAGT
jgi:pyruvate ferredoxin oxidoreductase beta subunit